jgi:hypothetical protein
MQFTVEVWNASQIPGAYSLPGEFTGGACSRDQRHRP